MKKTNTKRFCSKCNRVTKFKQKDKLLLCLECGFTYTLGWFKMSGTQLF